MSKILKIATNRSLILVDEFPKSLINLQLFKFLSDLNYSNGVAIFGSLITHLKSDSFI